MLLQIIGHSGSESHDLSRIVLVWMSTNELQEIHRSWDLKLEKSGWSMEVVLHSFIPDNVSGFLGQIRLFCCFVECVV